MRYRIVLIGSRRWTASQPLTELADNPRIHVAARLSVDVSIASLSRLSADIGVVRLNRNPRATVNLLKDIKRRGVRSRMIATLDSMRDEAIQLCVEQSVWGCVPVTADANTYYKTIVLVSAGKLSYPREILDRIVTHRGQMSLRDDEVPRP